MGEPVDRTLVPGKARGAALVLTEPLSFWGGIDPGTGCVIDTHHPQEGATVTGLDPRDAVRSRFELELLRARRIDPDRDGASSRRAWSGRPDRRPRRHRRRGALRDRGAGRRRRGRNASPRSRTGRCSRSRRARPRHRSSRADREPRYTRSVSTCAACSAPNDDAARFCSTCGAQLLRSCPACGALAPLGARFCPECGTALNAPATSEPLEERRLVSIVFADLAGFTERSDRADPEDVRGILLPFHALAKEEIERFGGTLDKFIGDAAMGVFGAPVAHEDDAERAVRAALAIGIW